MDWFERICRIWTWQSCGKLPSIPQTGGVNNYIAGLMADLTFLGVNNPGKCYYKATQDSFCVEWLNVPFWDQNFPTYNGSTTFEIIFVNQIRPSQLISNPVQEIQLVITLVALRIT